MALVPRRRLLWTPKHTMAKEIKTVTDDISQTRCGLNRCALPILHHHIDIQIRGIDHGAGDKNEERRLGRVDLVSSGIGDILMEDDPRGVLGVQHTRDQEQTQHDSWQETQRSHGPHLHHHRHATPALTASVRIWAYAQFQGFGLTLARPGRG